METEAMKKLRGQTITELSRVLNEAKSSGISNEDLKKCLRAQNFPISTSPNQKPKPKSLKWRLVSYGLYLLVFAILPVLFCLVLLYFPVSAALEGSSCLVPQFFPFPEVVRPVANCSICSGIFDAPRLQNISRYDFIRQYAYSSKPVLVLGAALEWPAMDMFSYEYFRELYHSVPDAIESDGATGQFFAYSSNIRNLKELFELSAERASMTSERWYIGWSSSDLSIGTELQKHFSVPYFLPPGSSQLELAWIFMGAPGPGASMHVDSVELPSWQAQLTGKKTWTLVPPPECESVCYTFNITVNRGDIIVVDTNFWYHQTYIHPGSISITIGAEFQ